MYFYLFQYSSKDLQSKFRHTITTNQMILSKRSSGEGPGLKEHTRKLDLLSGLDRESGAENSSIIFSDIKDFSSTNMSSIMQNQDEKITTSLLRPFESGLTIFNNFQQMLLYRKPDDEFYAYKMKIYDVGSPAAPARQRAQSDQRRPEHQEGQPRGVRGADPRAHRPALPRRQVQRRRLPPEVPLHLQLAEGPLARGGLSSWSRWSTASR